MKNLITSIAVAFTLHMLLLLVLVALTSACFLYGKATAWYSVPEHCFTDLIRQFFRAMPITMIPVTWFALRY
jgi:hypothetical protein